MKKDILKAQLNMKQKELELLAQDLKAQWDEGFMLVPNHFKVQLVDEGWIDVNKSTPPNGQMVLVWMEYDDNGNTCQTYGFGQYDGDGWIVFLQEATQILAWSTLPEPYVREE